MHWPASRANQSHARWPTAAAVALVAVAVLATATPAGAAVTLGQLPAAPPSPSCNANFDYLQPSITGGNLYTARQAGTITSWSTNSSGGGATYVFKVFRRTTDPDVFTVTAHAPRRTLSPGLNTYPASISVRPGDLIGFHETGLTDTSCTFPVEGDAVLKRNTAGSLSDGASDTFGPENDLRLNLSAVLVPSNDFSVAAITRDRKRGSAMVIVNVSNPGVIAISGKGMRKKDASKNVAVAGTVQFQIASAGARKRRLQKTGKVTLTPTLTFFPAGGDPASQAFTVRLRKRRHPAIRPVALSRRERP